jgi:DNA (cytosine-5)-methyltransferase 1
VTRATDQGCAHCGGIAKVHADSGLCPDCQSPTLLPMPATVNGKSGRAMTASTDNGRRSGGGQSSPLGLEETASLLAGDVPDSDHLPLGNLPPASQAVVDALLLPTPTAQRTLTGGTDPGNWQDVLNLLPTPTSQAAKHGGTPDVNANGYGSNLWDLLPHLEFGPYAPAIARWEAVLGRPAPSPTEPGRDGRPRLSPLFVEWMMGLPAGHVTDPAIGLTRAQQLKALGNGVCPAQARLAVSLLTGMGAAPTLPTLPTLPTPTVSDGNGAGAHGGGGNDLRTTVALLPTPAVNDMGAGKTPADWDAWTARMKGAHGNGNGHGKSLAIEALRLGEPM